MTAAEGNVTNLPALMRVRVRLRLDGSVERDGYAPQRLTRVESRLLLALARRSTCLSKEVLYSELYSSRAHADMPEPKIVDVFVCKLRAKLAALGAKDALGTVWGRGYQLNRPNFDVDLEDETHLSVPVDGDLLRRLEELAPAMDTTVPALVVRCVREALPGLTESAWA